MATRIIIKRKKEWANRLKPFKIFINSAEKGQVPNGSSEEFAVEPGSYDVQAKISWFLSKPFTVDIAEGETKYLLVRSGMKYFLPFYTAMLMGIMINCAVAFGATPKTDFLRYLQLILIVPGLTYLMYYFTVGRKNYIVVEKDPENIFG